MLWIPPRRCGFFACLVLLWASVADAQEKTWDAGERGWKSSLSDTIGSIKQVGKDAGSRRADALRQQEAPSACPALPYPAPEDRDLREAQLRQAVADEDWEPRQREPLLDLYRLGLWSVDLWHGSHIVLHKDRGRLYEQWKKLQAVPRASSHYQGVDSPQFEIPFKRHAMLFGLTSEGDTWLQFENHAAGSAASALGHCGDFFQSKAVQMNIGPLGLSPHTEHSDPIVVEYGEASPTPGR